MVLECILCFALLFFFWNCDFMTEPTRARNKKQVLSFTKISFTTQRMVIVRFGVGLPGTEELRVGIVVFGFVKFSLRFGRVPVLTTLSFMYSLCRESTATWAFA